ncbi:filamentous hemagglutinin N-terminal domain-containing protein [Aeromonas sanarellii]|uniref:two-partner secretion domain-containing protein n=1 Tax=Aeromonas sanarellii TaxID=633415 RepID=UPI003B9F28E4
MAQREPQLSLVCRAVVYQLCLVMALQSSHPAFAAGIAVATGNTTLNQAGNGVPIVDIATPNGAGVSHNLYQHFNVGPTGVILNNATGQLTQTQLGGLIQNNPHLPAQPGQGANLIINEVVGASPTQMQGYLEVAGKPAGVVVANPNGLTCDGCGFINTPNITLSTGKPVLDAQGQLQALDVKRGVLTVGGKGLDASRQDSVDLIARAVALNGALHGKTVNVVAGANRVNRQTGEVAAQAGDGPAPVVAIDTAALGGMYAGKIRLVSTEHGVGVNLARVVASQGDLALDAKGRVRLNEASATGSLQVKGGADVTLSGRVQAGGSARVDAAGALTGQAADVRAAQDVALTGQALQLHQGQVASGGTLRVQADEQLALSGGTLQAKVIEADAKALDNRASLTAAEVNLRATQLIQAGEVQGDRVSLTGSTVHNAGAVRAQQGLNITGRTLDNTGTLNSGQSLTVSLGDSGRNAGGLSAAGALDIQAANRWEQTASGKSEAGAGVILRAREGVLAGESRGQDVAITADALTVTGVVRGSAVRLSAGKLANQGEVQASGRLAWQGRELDNRGRLQGDQQVALSGQTLSNQGTLVSGQDVVVQAQALTNTGHLAGQSVVVDARQLTSRGTLLGVSRLALTGDDMVLTGQQLTDGELQLGSRLLTLSGQTSVGGTAKVAAEVGQLGGALKAQSLVLAVNQAKNDGKLHSREGVQWLGDSLTTGDESELIAGRGMVLTGGQLTLGGTIGVGQALTITGDQVNQHGVMASGQAVNIHAGSLALDGQVQGQTVQLTSERGSQRGQLLAADTLTWQSQQLASAGRMQADNALTLSGNTLSHNGVAVTRGHLALDFVELNSQGGLFARDMTLTGTRLNVAGTALSCRLRQCDWVGNCAPAPI